MNEIRILSSIDHPNIVAYKECFLSNNNKELYIVMEYVGGGDMSAKIKDLNNNRKKLNENLIWQYLC